MERNILVNRMEKYMLSKNIATFCCQMADGKSMRADKDVIEISNGFEITLAVHIDRSDDERVTPLHSLTVSSNVLNGEFNLLFERTDWFDDMIAFVIMNSLPR